MTNQKQNSGWEYREERFSGLLFPAVQMSPRRWLILVLWLNQHRGGGGLILLLGGLLSKAPGVCVHVSNTPCQAAKW